MSVENIRKLKAEKGFTIVELLIVIVVIGILAAIVIVAYTGITNTANTNKAKANAASVQKVAETMNADETGSYPGTVAAFSTGSTTTKLPQGVSVTASGACTSPCNLANATAAATTTLNNVAAANKYNTVVAFKWPATGTATGGLLFYRDADGGTNPVYFGNATPTSTPFLVMP